MAAIDRKPGIRPRVTLGRRLDIAARRAFPVGCTVLLMLACETPFGFEDQAVLLPASTLGCVYFWTLFRPSAMPPPAVFLIGLLLDLLGYLPIGVGVLTLLAVHGVTIRWRRVLTRQRFVWVWCAFGVLATGAAVVTWAFDCLLSVRLLPLAPALFEAVLAIALYPAIAILFARAHRGVADPERA
jgi:rod shape-determining protein MreD